MVGFLKTAFVQGRLSRDELADRAGHALEARTRAQLLAVSAGIPPAPAVPVVRSRQPGPVPARTRARPLSRKAVAWALSMIVVLPGLSFAYVATYYGPIIVFLLLGFTAAVLLEVWCPSQPNHRAH